MGQQHLSDRFDNEIYFFDKCGSDCGFVPKCWTRVYASGYVPYEGFGATVCVQNEYVDAICGLLTAFNAQQGEGQLTLVNLAHEFGERQM